MDGEVSWSCFVLDDTFLDGTPLSRVGLLFGDRVNGSILIFDNVCHFIESVVFGVHYVKLLHLREGRTIRKDFEISSF